MWRLFFKYNVIKKEILWSYLFVLYVKMPKDRWDDVRKAESLTPEGDKILFSLKKECAEKYMNYGDHDATEGVDKVDFEH